jgi:hypothetical protein
MARQAGDHSGFFLCSLKNLVEAERKVRIYLIHIP